MKRLSLVLIFLLSLSFALDVTAIATPNVVKLQEGNGTVIQFEVQNHESSSVDLRLAVNGVQTWARISNSAFSLLSGQSMTSTFYFSDKAPAASYIYILELTDEKTGEKVWEGSIVIQVMNEDEESSGISTPERYLKIAVDKSSVVPGDNVLIILTPSLDFLLDDVEITLISEDGEVSKVSGALDKIKKEFTLSIPETQSPGEYTIKAYIIGKGMTNKTSLTIKELSKVEIQTQIERKLLGKTITFTGKNIGNVFKMDYLTTSIGLIDRPLLEASPVPEITSNGMSYDLTWEYRLQPGEEVVIASYSVDYIPYSIILVLFVIALVLIIQKPEAIEAKKIVEQLKGADETRFKIKLIVSNSSDEPVDEAVLTDLVPTIATVTKAYIVKPDTSKTKDGLVMKWALGRLEPGEERIIAYEMALGFGIIGNLELPKPKITWQK